MVDKTQNSSYNYLARIKSNYIEEWSIYLLIKNGKAPIKDIIIHDRPTIINPSFAKKSFFFGFFIDNNNPTIKLDTIGIK